MKSEKQIREELELLESDLKHWQAKYERVDLSRPDGITRRMVLGNTVVGIEGQIEALKWMLEDHQ